MTTTKAKQKIFFEFKKGRTVLFIFTPISGALDIKLLNHHRLIMFGIYICMSLLWT